MSELLTTGEMIDRLKVGEKAERKWEVTGVCHDRFTHVMKDADGDLCFSDGEFWELEPLSGALIDSKWRILPNYVSFEEAMQALKEAKQVFFHGENWKSRIVYGQLIEDSEVSGYTFAQLINGKWTIEED